MAFISMLEMVFGSLLLYMWTTWGERAITSVACTSPCNYDSDTPVFIFLSLLFIIIIFKKKIGGKDIYPAYILKYGPQLSRYPYPHCMKSINTQWYTGNWQQGSQVVYKESSFV